MLEATSNRRALFAPLLFLAAAPAIVRVGSLMKVKAFNDQGYIELTGFDEHGKKVVERIPLTGQYSYTSTTKFGIASTISLVGPIREGHNLNLNFLHGI